MENVLLGINILKDWGVMMLPYAAASIPVAATTCRIVNKTLNNNNKKVGTR